MSRHHCHADGCKVPVRPTLLMCAAHWAQVPPSIKEAVNANYRRGQCDDRRPSPEWLRAARAAINAVKGAASE